MNRLDDMQRERELVIDLYIQAFDSGDLDTLTKVLSRATTDPELDRLLVEVNAALYDEDGLTSVSELGARVRQLLAQHMPSAMASLPDDPPSPPTVGDVARELESELPTQPGLSAADRWANRQLLGDETPLPQPVTAATIAKLAGLLRVQASDRYWEQFRRAAVKVRMARERSRVELAAARRHRHRRRPGPGGTSEEGQA